jgi:16S rRNA (cytosine967-C5)-methyltransferase
VRHGVPLDTALDRSFPGLCERDRRLAHELALGTLRTAGALDRVLAPFVPGGLDRVPPPVRDLLRLGAYQLTGLDRVPAFAAVSTAVALARESGHRRAAPFVNAVLRRLAEQAPRIVPGRATHPGWLVARWTARYGAAETARLQAWNDTRPRLVVQPARWEVERLVQSWTEAGIGWTEAPYGAGLMPSVRRPADLPGYREGGFIVQDAAQALVVRFFDLPAGSTIYDACAAPGGKTIALGRTARLVLAADVSLPRVRRLHTNLLRAGSGREYPLVADALRPPVEWVDAVVLDVPCLGTGVLARNPEARWRARPEALTRLVAAARAMLDAAATTVRVGGWLCFSTCSLEPEENEVQIEQFLQRDPRYRRDPGTAVPEELRTPQGDLALFPPRHGTDGAYAARLRRIA